MRSGNKVVIVGAGLISKFHANAVAAIPELQLKCFVDIGDDLHGALSDPEVGLVLVATPSGVHDEAVLAAAEHGIPVLCEKPLSITTARIDAMIAACDRAGVPLGCMFQTRWDEEYAQAREQIASGALGRITFASVRIPWWRETEYYTNSPWHGTRKIDGGGALMNQGIHMIDWLVSLMPPVTDVKAFTSTLVHPIEVEDTAAAAIRFEGGALGTVYGTTASFPGRSKWMEITGSKGTLELGVENKGGSARPDSFGHELHRRAIKAFWESFHGGAPYPVDGREARKSVALIERIYGDSPLQKSL